MGLMDEWGNALVEEGLREAADTFFGARKDLEDEIVFFKERIARLQTMLEEIRSWFAGLNCLLGNEEKSRFLFSTLDIQLPDEQLYTDQVCSLQFQRPRSFTRKGLFTKAVWEVYSSLAALVEKYMQGVPYADPAYPGRVLITVNYNQVCKQCAELNVRIDQLNTNYRPSESLAFAKRMDQELVDKERIIGGGAQSWVLDQDLAFKPLQFAHYALLNLPLMPTDTQAKAAVQACCAQIFSQKRSHVHAVLDELLDPEQKKICILERSKT